MPHEHTRSASTAPSTRTAAAVRRLEAGVCGTRVEVDSVGAIGRARSAGRAAAAACLIVPAGLALGLRTRRRRRHRRRQATRGFRTRQHIIRSVPQLKYYRQLESHGSRAGACPAPPPACPISRLAAGAGGGGRGQQREAARRRHGERSPGGPWRTQGRGWARPAAAARAALLGLHADVGAPRERRGHAAAGATAAGGLAARAKLLSTIASIWNTMIGRPS